VQKQLNQLICHFGCGLGWAEGSISSVIFTRWCQCAHMGRHIGATWRIWLNRPSVAMRSYVKLLWPLVLSTSSPCHWKCLTNLYYVEWAIGFITTSSIVDFTCLQLELEDVCLQCSDSVGWAALWCLKIWKKCRLCNISRGFLETAFVSISDV